MNIQKLIFIIPDYQNITPFQRALYYYDFPSGILGISSYLRERRVATSKVIDLRVEEEKNKNFGLNIKKNGEFKRDFIKILENESIQEYDYVAISCYSSFQYLQTEIIAKIIKEEFPNLKIMAGGYHPTAVPEDFLNKNSPYDYIIIGEGEKAVEMILKTQKNSQKGSPRIIKSKEILDINNLPFPDYEMYLERYPLYDKYKFNFYASRGCPHQCSFCASNYRFRTLTFENFKVQFKRFAELAENYCKKSYKFNFADQAFDKIPITEKILDFIRKEEYHKKFTFFCHCRLEKLSENNQLLNKFIKNNFIIGFGFESASKKILKEMHKTKDPALYIKKAIKLLQYYENNGNLFCRFNIICGFPGETNETFLETVRFLKQYAMHDGVQVSPSLFMNYPNSYVYKYMSYYEKKFGSKFVKEWWKLPGNQWIYTIPLKSSDNYTIKELFSDYIQHYFPIIKSFRRTNFSDLIKWIRFYKKFRNVLINQKLELENEILLE
ncbi:MAG: B12-binding domain-containing radical SAM protein [Promethearchaeia archaeon]